MFYALVHMFTALGAIAPPTNRKQKEISHACYRIENSRQEEP